MTWVEIGKQDLLERGKMVTVAKRMQAMLTRNPFIEGLIDDYLMFRNHNKIRISLALAGSALRIEIDRHNREQDEKNEEYPTVLCGIEALKDMRSDILPP